MLDYYRSYATAPEFDEHFRRANEARAAAWYDALRSVAKAASVPARAATFLAGKLLRWHRERTAIRLLEALDERMLLDAGIARHEIPDVVRSRSVKVQTSPSEFAERSTARLGMPRELVTVVASQCRKAVKGEGKSAEPLPSAA